MELSEPSARPGRDQLNLLRDLFGRKDEVDAAAVYSDFRHVRLTGYIELLSDCYAIHVFDAASRGRIIAMTERMDLPPTSTIAQQQRRSSGSIGSRPS